MTVQSDAHLADVRTILAQHGVLEASLDEAELQFADVSEFTDYHDLMNNVKEAETAFMKMPSKVRESLQKSIFANILFLRLQKL